MPLGPEDQLTGWLRQRVASRGSDLIGDDATFLPGTRLAVTVDQQLEGVHFPKGLSPATIGRRLVAVNLSDAAAVGGKPTLGFLALAAPSGFPIKALLAAVEKELVDHGARLAGGDLAKSSLLGASLTLLAQRCPRSHWLERSAAKAGDRLWIGGTVGESAIGRLLLAQGARYESGRVVLAPSQDVDKRTSIRARRAIRRHLLPQPQLELGSWLAKRRRAAAIDVSDGTLLDLERLCRASGVGALLDAERLPKSERFEECAALVGADPIGLALTGGEDYVLLFTLPEGIRPPASLGARAIGHLRSQCGIEVVGASGSTPRPGWDHFAS
jgi:thiamine-monophosphate kinase